MSFKINLHNKKRESVSDADKQWLGKRVKDKDGREIWNKDPAYSNDLTRPVWLYFKYDHPEHLISCGWSIGGTLVISEITNPIYKEYKDFGKMWYDSDADLLRMEFDNGKKLEFPTDTELETLTSCILDNKPSAPTESKGEAYYSQGNRDGRNYAPMKTQESFPNRAAFLSYKKGYNEALDGIYEETGDQEFDKEVKDLKSKSDMGSLVNALDGLTDEQLALLEKGFGDGEYAEKMDTTTMNIKAKDLHPTQNEIDVGKSLSYQVSGKNPEQVKQILDGGPVTVNLPLVVYDYNGTYYIVDGHHRWSQVFLLNPNCEIDSLVFKNSAGDTAQDPADMLRDFQGAIAIANDGEVPQSTVAPGMNMFDWSSDQLREYLEKNIQDGMVSAYQDFYNSEIDKDDIENAIIGNAGLMKKSNKPIKNAPSRAVMPQTDTGVKKTGVAGIEIAKKGMTDL
ncbi:MAG: hypothetical protein IKT27_05490 [Clostridia bacterium]|nr:hypothetical protein [Clostridia bacterium]